MTLEEKAEAYKEKLQKDYIEAQHNGYMPSIWANIDNIWLDGAREVLKMKVNTTTVSDAPLEKDRQLEKAINLVHRLLVLIQKHKWWDYTVIDEARAFMSEVDRDKNND